MRSTTPITSIENPAATGYDVPVVLAPQSAALQPMAASLIDKVSVTLDQWADGPVAQGDVDGTGQTDEVFLHGNLNPSKAHYNEGDAVPYRAILDNTGW